MLIHDANKLKYMKVEPSKLKWVYYGAVKISVLKITHYTVLWNHEPEVIAKIVQPVIIYVYKICTYIPTLCTTYVGS